MMIVFFSPAFLPFSPIHVFFLQTPPPPAWWAGLCVWGGAPGSVGLVGWNGPVGRNVYIARKGVRMCGEKNVLQTA